MNTLTNGKIAIGAPFSMMREAQAETFLKYNDSSHGWVEVPIDLLVTLGIKDKISTYSYTNANNAYLEEDCDMPIFIRAYEEANGCTPKLIDNHEDRECFIRHFAKYE